MRDVAGRNRAQAATTVQYATEREVALFPLDLDVTNEASSERAVAEVLTQRD